MSNPFKTCGACRRRWASWEEFVADPDVRILGLQAVLRQPNASVLVFEHRCGSSVSVFTSRLRHLVPDHPALEWPDLRGGPECPRHCFELGDHSPCERRCAHAVDRALLQMVRAMKGMTAA